MRQKKVKALRKRLGLKLPIAPVYRVSNTVKKVVYFTNAMGETNAQTVNRITIVNDAKAQYRKLKKIFKGMK